ncbi:MAG: methyltransferase [Lachnospiraceae bacterium]|nr:methyltransferase [Lachnospiraceae bacterium]
MKINMQQWADDIIKAEDIKNLPVLYFPVLKDMGISVPDSVKDPSTIAKVMKRILDKYPDTIAAITGMDLTIDAQSFGVQVNFSEKQAPNIIDHILSGPEDIEGLKLPDIHSGRTDVFTESCLEAQKIITDRPIFGGMLGPFSLAANLLDINKCLKMTIKGKDNLHILLEKCTEWLTLRAKEYKNAGANGVLIAEPTAGLLAPAACEEFSSQYIKQIADALQDDHFFLILHDCGQVENSVESMCGTGCKGLHFGNGVDMRNIMPKVDPGILAFGNLDPATVFFMGTPDEVYDKTTALLEAMKPYPNFVLSSGCDLAPTVSGENIEAYYRACRDFNAR